MIITKLFLSIILLTCLVIYYCYYATQSTYVKSNVDGLFYQVRDLPDKQDAADTLAYIRRNITVLTTHMLKTAPKEYMEYVKALNKQLNRVVISENIHEFYYTSYSVNKGDKLVFCVRSRDPTSSDKKHDINLMMYVVLHEISHIACPEYGHEQKFRDIFKFITKNAVDLNLYYPIDFKNMPTEYCGMTISDSIV